MKWLLLFPLVLAAGCGPKQVRLATSLGSGSKWDCTPEPGGACTSATVDVPGLDGKLGTLQINLPPACTAGVREVLVMGLRTAHPTARVICAAPENKPGETP